LPVAFLCLPAGAAGPVKGERTMPRCAYRG
jgi:hypothetical protein